MQQDAADVMYIESDAELDTGLMSDEPEKETLQQSAGTGQALQPTSASTTATLLATCVQSAMEVQGEEEAMEAEAALDVNLPMPESDMATAVSSATPTPIPIYSMVVNSPPIPSIPTPTPNTITNCNSIFPHPAILLYSMRQGPHPSSTAQAGALVQSTLGELSQFPAQ